MGSAAPLEERYTGHILVSQYHISYVLPKEFPPASRSYDSSYGRRSGAHEIHFMAAIDIWVPFVSKPPSYPYLVSLKLCIHRRQAADFLIANDPSPSLSL